MSNVKPRCQPMISTTAAVEYAARVAATCQTLESGRNELVELGLDEEFAARLLFVVPHAFGTVFYERQGIPFCATFLDGPAGYDAERRFTDEPAYPAALDLGRSWLDSENSSLFHAACDWSAQVAVARDRMARGLPLDDLRDPPRHSYLVVPWYGGPPRRPGEV
jgi:hypothetical protein